MTKLEYDSFYKFLVSLGVAITTIAFLILWLFFKEPYDLLIESSKINNLTPTAKDLILLRQGLIKGVFNYLPWAVLIITFIGLAFIGYGLYVWKGRQKVLDEQEELSNEKLKAEIKSLTPAEVVTNLVREITEDVTDSQQNNTLLQDDMIKLVSSSMEEYLSIGQMVSNKIEEAFSTTHKILKNQRLGRFEYDIILQGMDILQRDYIIELKYIRASTNYGWIINSWNRLLYASKNYQTIMDKIAKPILLIVAPNIRANAIQNYIERFINEHPKSKNKIIVINEDALRTITGNELRAKL